MKISQGGFTLIEVLTASMILFIAISLASFSFKISLKSDDSIKKQLNNSLASIYIKEIIFEELRVDPNLGSGSGLWFTYEYSWSVIDRKSSYSNGGFDPDTQMLSESGIKVELISIEMFIEGDSVNVNHIVW